MSRTIAQSLSLLSLFTSLVASTASAGPASFNTVWSEASQLVRSCALQTICVSPNGNRRAARLDSQCSDLRLLENEVRFRLNGTDYRAVISESSESDGGDLNDLAILETAGRFLGSATNILGFNDPLLTLLGGSAEQLRTQYVRCR